MMDFIAKYWLEALFTLILSGIGVTVKMMFTQFKALKLGMQAILRNGIIEQYHKYMDKKYIPIYALENVTAMYSQYHALGGNGTITHLYEELLELPNRKEDVKP
ncbi:MAG TPA: hypothetical protein GXX75_09115 [Clostridiales bacterium]|nr:hypothetical protein [Clostridiales bacterium]